MKKFLYTAALCAATLVGCTSGGEDDGTENGGGNGGGQSASVIFPLEGRVEKFEIYDDEYRNVDGQSEETYHYSYEMTYDARGRMSRMYGEAISDSNNRVLETELYTFEYDDAAHTAVVAMVYTDIYAGGSEPNVEKDSEQWVFDDAWRVKTVRDLEDPSEVSVYSYDAKGCLLSMDFSDEYSKISTVLDWTNGNLTTLSRTDSAYEHYENIQTFEYGSEMNPFAGKAFNIFYTYMVFVDLGLPAIVGFTGVGMKNLPTAVSFFETGDERPYVDAISYEYDAKGRISRIDRRTKTDTGASGGAHEYCVLHYAE